MTAIGLFIAAALASGAALWAGEARAGWYLAPAVKWVSFAARPVDDEATPNYYGIAGAGSFGYSVGQVLDLAGFGQYVPGARGGAGFAKDDASLVSYGGEVGLRLAEQVYLGVRGGLGAYRLYHPRGAGDGEGEGELSGKWNGSAGGFAIGALAKLSKESYLQTTLEVMHHVLTNASDKDLGKRRIDSFGIGFAYVFNGYSSSFLDNSLFKNFLDSMIY
jgi:hypothetical protein